MNAFSTVVILTPKYNIHEDERKRELRFLALQKYIKLMQC